MLWRGKGCFRCGGDVVIHKKDNRWYALCHQCGLKLEAGTLEELVEILLPCFYHPSSQGQMVAQTGKALDIIHSTDGK